MNNKNNSEQRSTILVVDYNPANYQVYKRTLKDSYRLVHAENVKQLMRACKLYHPSLIILDAEVPRYMGDEALVHLRSDDDANGIPVLAVVNEETNMGIYDFDPMTISLLKPFSKFMLVDVVEDMMNDFCVYPNENNDEAKLVDNKEYTG